MHSSFLSAFNMDTGERRIFVHPRLQICEMHRSKAHICGILPIFRKISIFMHKFAPLIRIQ